MGTRRGPGGTRTLRNPGAADDEPPLATHVLYASPEFFATPYLYDAAVGGSPTSYSPPVAVAEPLALQLIGGLQRLQLRFRNGRRNLHVQGGNFPDGAPVDLQLRRRRRRRYRLRLKAEGLGGTRRWASPSCWRRSRSSARPKRARRSPRTGGTWSARSLRSWGRDPNTEHSP